MITLNDRHKQYEKRSKRFYTDKLGEQHIVFDYSKVKMQEPKSFKRERKIGEHIVTLPECPPKKEIANYDLPVEEQRFYRNLPPDNFEFLPKEEQLDFMRTDLRRRLNGFFFYNNGRIEYMTGIHYFYCTHWVIDTGDTPEWRDSDRDIFYLWKHCEENELCHGLVYLTNRRSGKTLISTVILYEYASRNENSICALQSKTEADAKNVMRKIVGSWKKLPQWNKPTDIGDSNPTKELRFEAPKQRSSKGEKKVYKKVLNSSITFGASTEEFFDGYKLKRYLADEFGKTMSVDVLRRWYIVKECLNVGRKIVGKALFTTTVEELERGGLGCKKIWDKSNIKKAKPDGATESGMFRIFKPAWYGFEGFQDAYGYSVCDDPEIPVVNKDGDILTRGSKTYLLNQRKGLDLYALQSHKRKYPFSIHEAFTANAEESVFAVEKLQQQIDYNNLQTKLPLRRGNLVWRDGQRDTAVDFVETESGRWVMSQLPDIDERNNYTIKNGVRKPANVLKYAGGVDPFSHDNPTDKSKKSDGACYILKKLDPLNPTISNFFVCEYLYRTKTSTMFYEDMIMTAHFFGTELLIENNKIGCINYFKMRGMHGFLSRRPSITATANSVKQKEYGIPLTGSVARETLVEYLANYINDWVGELNPDNHGYGTRIMSANYFNNQLEQCMNFDVNAWTKYDAVVASGLAVLLSRSKTKKKLSEDKSNVSNYYQMYNVKGNKTTRL